MEIQKIDYRCEVCVYPCAVSITVAAGDTPPAFTHACVILGSNRTPIWNEVITPAEEVDND